MKHYFSIILLIFSIVLAIAQSKAKISSAEVSFTFVNNNVDGTIEGFSSESVLDIEQIENSKLKGSVRVETISTGNSIRNWSLRRGKYFDADKFPQITFESTSVKQNEEIIIVKGKLTIKGITEGVSFRFEKQNKLLIGKTTIYSSDYGINIKSEREKNKVLVSIKLKLE